MTHSADPTKHKEHGEQKARYEKRKASGHWTGKTKAQRDKEKAALKAKHEGTVSRGIGKAMGQGRELDALLEQLKK